MRRRHEATLINAQMGKLSAERYAAAVRRRAECEDGLVSILRDDVDQQVFAVPDMRITAVAILQMATGVSSWYRRPAD